jgi:hypothetical protein
MEENNETDIKGGRDGYWT